MGINRQLQTCLLFSIAGHLVCFCSVAVFFPHIGFKDNHYSTVNFLGTILTAPFAPEQQLADTALLLPKSKQLTAQSTNSKMESFTKKLDKKCIVHIPGSDCPARLFLPIEQTVINPANIIGPIGKDTADKDSLKKLSLDIEDSPSLLQREIIYQPPFPKYYELSEFKPKRNYAIFKIYISSAGTIEEIVNIKFSGNPEMDMALARYINKWRFAPAFEQEGQWQIVKINLQTGTGHITTCENNQ